MKYPLLRVEDVMAPGANGQPVVVSEQAVVADHIIVQLLPGSNQAELEQLAAQNGAALVKTPKPGLYLVQLPNPDLGTVPQAIQAYGQFKGLLKYAEADSVVHSAVVPNDPSFAGEWGLNNTGQTSGTAHADIGAEAAWGIINQSPNVLVAVIDTGIDFNHPDLQANIWTNPSPGTHGYANDLHGWNFYAGTNNSQDDNFHGTHVSGTIGAVGNNGVGVTGVSWNVKIVPLKFLDNTGSGYTSDAVNAIYYATAIGAKIMSNSWGGSGYSQALKDAIDAANSAGILFVAAAGNDDTDTDTNPTYPADFTSSNIISVAATDDTDHLASFSNYGTTTVQLAAPGVGVLSTFPTVATAAMTSEGLPTNYGQISGTSMATPHVSGVAALALAQNPALTVAQLRAQLLARVTQLPQLSGLVQTSGRLNAYNVVNTAWQPAGVQLTTTGVAMVSEATGTAIANPGAIIDFTPAILNSGGVAATNVTATLVSNQSTATVLTSTLNKGTMAPFARVNPGPFRVQLSSGLADKTAISFDMVVTADGITAIHTPVTVVVSAPQPSSQATVAFACGEIKADPTRNLVYLTDTTNHRVFAIDTGLGQVSASTPLDITPGPNPPSAGQANQIGQMAVSIDGTRLYVALTTQQEIEVLSLPSLSPLATLPVSFSPVSLAAGVGGRLFASSTDGWGLLREVSSSTGSTIASFGKGANQSFYQNALLRTNVAGTKLYAAETALSGSVETIYPYDISSGGETLLATYSCPMDNLVDFGIDELENRLYTLNGGVYGVGVTDMTTGSYSTVWPFGSAYAAGVTFLPNDTVIYGASGDPYSGNIRKFNRADGTPLGDYVVGVSGAPIKARGIAITPNGEVLYVRNGGSAASYIGLIGGSPITVTNPPPPTATPAAIALATVPFSDTEGNGDGVANPGEIIDLTPTFKNIGGTTGTNVSVSLATAAGATVLTPSGAQVLGTVAVGATVPVPAPYRVQLASGLVDGTAINFTFTVNWDTGKSQQFVYSQVVHTSVASSDLTSSLQFGEILADQQRDFVYIIDKRYLRLLVFDTDAACIVKAVPLGGLTTVNGLPPAPAMMAESVDGSKLFVALPQSQIIQEFSLPDMTSLAQWSYTFEPESLACDAQGRIYCTTADATQALVQIDGTDGAVLGHSGPAFVSTYYNGNLPSILHRNTAGTELYGALTSNIYRFSTTGSSAPSQLAVLSTNTANYQIYDFTVDDAAARLYVLAGQNLTVVPLGGSIPTTWNLSQGFASAVSYLHGSNLVNVGCGSVIQQLSESSGTSVQSFSPNLNSGAITYRGLATTPNGRSVFIGSRFSGSYEDPSVDGYDYSVGMLGGAVNLDIPASTVVGLLSVAVTDPSPGSADGYVHPGQTVQLAPILKNFTNDLMSAVSVQLVSPDPLAVVQSPSTASIGNVGGYVSFSPASTFKVAIGSAATDGYELKLTLQVSYNNGTQQSIPYSLFVNKPVMAQAAVNFAVGAMLSDSTRDLAYVVDNTNNRLLAIDTDLGVVSKSVNLASAPGTGRMCLSFDGTRLYVALSAAQQIQVFSLPALEQVDIINLNFQPYSLVAPADGKLYASSTQQWDSLREIDPISSTVVGAFSTITYEPGTILRVDPTGSTFYVKGSTGTLDQYSTSPAGLPLLLKQYPLKEDNLYDFQIDTQYQRAYIADGGFYGVGVTDLAHGLTGNYWPFGEPYGAGVCFLPTSSFVYGASGGAGAGGPGNQGLIRRFNRADGTPLADIVITTDNSELIPGDLVITANGHLLYAKNNFTGSSNTGENGYLYTLGIIGCSTLTVAPPTAAPAVYAGSDITVHLSQAAALVAAVTDSVSNLPVSWKVVSGPGGATINSSSTNTTASFPSTGTYRVQGSTTQGGLVGSDLINVTVIPDLPAVSVTAPVATRRPQRHRRPAHLHPHGIRRRRAQRHLQCLRHRAQWHGLLGPDRHDCHPRWLLVRLRPRRSHGRRHFPIHRDRHRGHVRQLSTRRLPAGHRRHCRSHRHHSLQPMVGNLHSRRRTDRYSAK